MMDIVLKTMKGKKHIHAGVVHASAIGEAQAIADHIRAEVNVEELIVTELTPVIGANVGPGVVGMGYYIEE